VATRTGHPDHIVHVLPGLCQSCLAPASQVPHPCSVAHARCYPHGLPLSHARPTRYGYFHYPPGCHAYAQPCSISHEHSSVHSIRYGNQDCRANRYSDGHHHLADGNR
jgi:hypothetical protein